MTDRNPDSLNRRELYLLCEGMGRLLEAVEVVGPDALPGATENADYDDVHGEVNALRIKMERLRAGAPGRNDPAMVKVETSQP